MDDRTRSILLQVAFKESVAIALAQGVFTASEIQTRTVELYQILTGLHTDLEIDPVYGYDGSSSERQPTGANAEGIPFTVDGVKWLDFRAAKDAGAVKPNFPDFKSADNRESLWLTDKDGNSNSEAMTLQKLADISA